MVKSVEISTARNVVGNCGLLKELMPPYFVSRKLISQSDFLSGGSVQVKEQNNIINTFASIKETMGMSQRVAFCNSTK